MKQKFIILTWPRSGSYHLVSLLDSASDIRCFGEVFKGKAVELPQDVLKAVGLTKQSVDARNDEGLALMQRVFDVSGEPIQGFKAFPSQLKCACKGRIRFNPEWKYLLLLRNPLESYMSLERAKRTGKYVLRSGETRDENRLHTPIDVDIEHLLDRIGWQQRMHRRFQRLLRQLPPGSAKTVRYEWLGEPDRLQEVLDFLGSNALAGELVSDKARQFVKPFWDGVSNRQQVQDALIDNGHQDLVEGVEHLSRS